MLRKTLTGKTEFLYMGRDIARWGRMSTKAVLLQNRLWFNIQLK